MMYLLHIFFKPTIVIVPFTYLVNLLLTCNDDCKFEYLVAPCTLLYLQKV